MSLRVRIARVTVLPGVLALLAGALPGAASAGSCLNEEVRAEQGAERLPDCRAFELVSPAIKADNSTFGQAIVGTPYGFPDGNHVHFSSLLPLPGAQSTAITTSNLSRRTPSGWVTTSLAAPIGPGETLGLLGLGGFLNAVRETAYTSDFSAAFVNSSFAADPLDQDGAVDVYRMAILSGAGSLAALPDSGPLTASMTPEVLWTGTWIADVSGDGSHVLFMTEDKLPTAPGTPVDDTHEYPGQLYDRTGGHTYLVGVLPDGSKAACAVFGAGALGAGKQQSGYGVGALSPDGSNVVFGACGQPKSFLRENNASTVELPGAGFIGRSADGSSVFTEGGNKAGVYEYDVATGTSTTITLEGNLVASSADGSRVYYWIRGGPEMGLYLWEGGVSKLIPNAGAGFASSVFVSEDPENPQNDGTDIAVATPDGSKLLFLDTTSLTGYNNLGPACGGAFKKSGPGPCYEAYIYDANTGSVTCVSCNPTGNPPLGNSHLMGTYQKDQVLPGYSLGEISPGGSRVFFETVDALVPQDTNGVEDVYEWENGRIYLISSGQGTRGSIFSGASSDGSSVFLTTTDHLAPQDIESSTQIYDARVDGGFVYAPFTSGCDSGQCQGPQTPAPAFGAPASATFVGLGNPVPAAVTPSVKAKPKAKPKKKRKTRKTDRASGRVHGKHKGRK
jgi:hypothetical protein